VRWHRRRRRHPEVLCPYADDLGVTASKSSTLASSDPAARYSYVAGQPIFTVDEKVFGYERLFRDGVEDYFREQDADVASRKTLDASQQMGLHPRSAAKGLHYSLTVAAHRG
jgi:hypothetical protein